MLLGGERLVGQEEAVNASLERFTFNRKQEWGLYGHDTGIHPLNMMIGGWIPAKVTTIAARSGMGKTATTVQMFDAGRRPQRGRRAEYLFFTWEMEPSYLVDRHICYKVGITNRLLGQGAKLLGNKFMSKIEDAYGDAKKLPVIYQQNSTSIGYIKKIFSIFIDMCKEKSEIEGVEILPVGVVDYIGMAKGEGKNQNKTYDIADFINGIKSFANETMSSWVLFAQINRLADERDLPTRQDLSDSSSIENASDNLILLHRPEYLNVPEVYDPDSGKTVSSENKMILRALKSRDFGVGDKLIGCDVKYNRFYDLSHTWDFPYWKMYSEEKFWLYELGFSLQPFKTEDIKHDSNGELF